MMEMISLNNQDINCSSVIVVIYLLIQMPLCAVSRDRLQSQAHDQRRVKLKRSIIINMCIYAC